MGIDSPNHTKSSPSGWQLLRGFHPPSRRQAECYHVGQITDASIPSRQQFDLGGAGPPSLRPGKVDRAEGQIHPPAAKRRIAIRPTDLGSKSSYARSAGSIPARAPAALRAASARAVDRFTFEQPIPHVVPALSRAPYPLLSPSTVAPTRHGATTHIAAWLAVRRHRAHQALAARTRKLHCFAARNDDLLWTQINFPRRQAPEDVPETCRP